MILWDNFVKAFSSFHKAKPFDHCVVDDFLDPKVAVTLEREFLDYNSSQWFIYKNAIEDKKTLNNWGMFPKHTYKLFHYLTGPFFTTTLSTLVVEELYADVGLHGGGWHAHGVGGNLNPHLDYSIHPKLGLQRKLNIIIYISNSLIEAHGGHLGLWEHDAETNQPGKLVKEIQPKFNRAVVFDTTQNSWHGMSRPLTQPEGIYRKSLAIYYLCDPPALVDTRGRALFAPREEQKGNSSIEELIRKRST